MKRSSALARAITPVLAAMAATMAPGCKDKGIHGDTGHQTMSGFAEGYNILIGEVPGLLERYFENTPADGPTLESLTEKKTWLCSGPGFFEMKRTQAKKALASAKSSANEELKHLGPMADALWEASMEIVSLSEEYCKYIQAEDFKDDKGAKAKEYHAKWTAVAEKYGQAQHAFSDALDKVEDAQIAKDIEKHAKDKGYSYWFRQFNHKAKAFMAQLRLEPKSLPKHYGDLEPIYGELSEFTKGKGAGLNSTFKSYQDAADRFFANVKKLNRAFAEAKDDAAREKLVEERFSSIVSDYNSLVTWYSSLTQAEGYDQLK